MKLCQAFLSGTFSLTLHAKQVGIERGCGMETQSALSYSEMINKILWSRKFCANVRPSGTQRLGPYVGTVKVYYAFAFASKTTCFPHVLGLACLMLVPVCFKLLPIGIIAFRKMLLICTGCSSCDTTDVFVKPSRFTRARCLGYT